MTTSTKYLRNFCIIAHIDHGKSTLADRIIELCSDISIGQHQQVLDSMELEKERGITIKSQSVALTYYIGGKKYLLNLIDTPGHADFSNEVKRSLEACEGALLLVDATAGVQAQTIANYKCALQTGLNVIPVINKIDLPSAHITKTTNDIRTILGINEEPILCSAKNNVGIEDVVLSIIERVQPPVTRHIDGCNTIASVIDAWFDKYLGVVKMIRMFKGHLNVDDRVQTASNGREHKIHCCGVFNPNKIMLNTLTEGSVGFITTGSKDILSHDIGDIIVGLNDTTKHVVTNPIQHQVFAGFFAKDKQNFQHFKKCISQLGLNDPSLLFQPEFSKALGYGFRCGFLGILHMDIVRERLLREYNVDVNIVSPSVEYKIHMKSGKECNISNPLDLPCTSQIDKFEEPIVSVVVLFPEEYLGRVSTLCYKKNAIYLSSEYLGNYVSCTYDMPLVDVISGFADSLKSVSKGYASFDYKDLRYKKADITILRVLINDEDIYALTTFVRKSMVFTKGKQIVRSLKENIDKHMFAIKIQAACFSKIVAREDISPLSKDVTAKIYGGDYTRKMKLWKKQSKGKKAMQMLGKVSIKQEAFISALVSEDL